MKMNVKKEDFIDIARCTMLAVISCMALILVFAVIVKFCELPDSVIMPVNVMIKAISVTLGVVLGLRSAEHGAVKGLSSGGVFAITTYLLFSIINGDFSVDTTFWIDSIAVIVEGILSGIVVVNIKGRHQQ